VVELIVGHIVADFNE
jgi:hypothetical protein